MLTYPESWSKVVDATPDQRLWALLRRFETHLDELQNLLRLVQELLGVVDQVQTAIGKVWLLRDLQTVSDCFDF